MKISPKCVSPSCGQCSNSRAGTELQSAGGAAVVLLPGNFTLQHNSQQQPAVPSMFSITRLVASSLACVWWHPIQFAVVVVSV